MAATIPGLGPDHAVPALNKLIDPGAAGLNPEEFFVLTRVDGRTSLRQLVLISGFPEARAVQILTKLHDKGILVLPGEEPRRPQARPATIPPGQPRPFERLTTPPMGIFLKDLIRGEAVDLTEEQKREIHDTHEALRGADLFTVLGVSRDADKRELKNAFRQRSKKFHPDNFFGKRLGSYKQMLSEIFDLVKSAHEILSDPDKRELYLAASVGSDAVPIETRSPHTPPGGNRIQIRRQAQELFDVACADQIAGDLRKALVGFGDAIAIDPQPRFFRRAAETALLAQELRLAEEYARKAMELDPHNAAAHRIHAKVLQSAGRRREARQALEEARRLDPENAHIVAELRDLGTE